MNQNLQSILNFIQQDEKLSDGEKNTIIKSLKDADKELDITTFKLDRTAKVKRTIAILLEETITELEQKRKAVEAQNRELEIESSLERVRTVALSMNKAGNMLDVCKAIALQLQSLGIQEVRNVQTAIFYPARGTYMNYEFYAKHDKTFVTETAYTNHQVAKAFAEQMFKGKGEVSITHIKGKEVKDWLDYQKTTNVFIDTYLESATSLSYYWHSLGPVALGISTYVPLSEEGLHLFQRFLKVFDLSYRRYLDIEKAEEQAKEATIETALEKVRSRSLAVHHSEEFKEVITVVFEKLQELGLVASSVSINIFIEDSKDTEVYICGQNKGEPSVSHFRLFYFDHPISNDRFKAQQSGLDFFSKNYGAEEKNSFYKYLFEVSDLKYMPDDIKEMVFESKSYTISLALAKKSMIVINDFEGNFLSEKEIDIVKRFAKVFEQAYIRFLDLQKAEAQAKEAQIEAALERVRSRSMAMQKSSELKEVIQVIYEQFVHLNIHVEHTGFIMDYKERDDMHIWLADHQSVPSQVTIPYFDSPHWNSFNEAKERGIDFFANHLTFEEKNRFYQDLFNHIPGVPEKTKEYYFSCPGLAVSTVLLENIGLYIENYSGIAYSDEENATLMRFGKVFQQTYTRFLDLQKAEAQAREAIKHASVDRVRAEVASMRTTKDLEKITPLVWNELTTLGVPFIRCGVFIMDEELQQVNTLLSNRDGKAIAAFHQPFSTPGDIAGMIKSWQKKEMYRQHWDENQFNEFTKGLVDQGAITSGEKYLTENRPIDLYLHFLPFLQGMLYVGNTTPLSDETLQSVQSLADAFSTAYARYEDFNKLEAANVKIEKTLLDLKQTQSQLVQSEKMASLGELTAGIAHEIQNPLNFVNNFSELNKELLEELNEEIEKGNYEEVKIIAKDVTDNEEKISHHGKRADAIVKGMLQHSRSSNATREPSDINQLADEYLRLSYHGLRAKDNSFNATLKTDYDESISTINIIPQDIGRVILNLLTNAFYAVAEKKKKQPENYEPAVFISTKKISNKVEISVKDNGNGIPQKVIDKIFQPFFTTKPTGQGTGLGLSLSYDIIKAHGGEIKVETREGEGTTFIILLPISELK